MENSEPRSFCSSRSRSCVISRPFTAIVPLLRRALGGSIREFKKEVKTDEQDGEAAASETNEAEKK